MLSPSQYINHLQNARVIFCQKIVHEASHMYRILLMTQSGWYIKEVLDAYVDTARALFRTFHQTSQECILYLINAICRIAQLGWPSPAQCF